MSIDNPNIAIPIILLFVFLVIWANRCSKCGKWFAWAMSSRTSTGSGYKMRWLSKSGSDTKKLTRVFEYNYNVTYVCIRCRNKRSSSSTSTWKRSTGSFKVNYEPTIQNEAGEHTKLPWYDFRVLTHGNWFTKLKKLCVLIFILLLLGMPIYNFDVVWYPSHFQSYLEKYAEFILYPFDQHFTVSTVKLVGGQWEVGHKIETYNGEKWIYTGVESLKGTKETILQADPPPYFTPPPIKGTKRAIAPYSSFEVCYKNLNTEKIYITSHLTLFRRSDREYKSVTVNEKTYPLLLRLQEPMRAYTLEFDSGGVSLDIFVSDEIFASF